MKLLTILNATSDYLYIKEGSFTNVLKYYLRGENIEKKEKLDAFRPIVRAFHDFSLPSEFLVR